MGRTKGSKNGIRKVPLKKPRVSYQDRFENVMEKKLTEASMEVKESTLPVFDSKVLRAYRSQKYEKCIRLIDRILINNTDDNKDHYKILQAASYTMLGENIEIAHSILDEVLEADHSNSFALYGKGVAFYFEGKMDESVAMFNRAIEKNPSEEMERAKGMKMRIDLERRKAIIMVQKMDTDQQVLNIELPEGFEKMIEDFNATIDEEFTELDWIESGEALGEALDDKMVEIEPATVQEMKIDTTDNEVQTKVSSSSDAIDDSKVETVEDTFRIDKSEVVSTKSFSRTPSPHIEADEAKVDKVIPEIPESLPKSFVPSTAEEFYAKGMELYMSGSLKKALKCFGKAVKLNPSFVDADDMGTKAQELLELMDVAAMNMTQKNYEAVVGILNEALEVDESNDYVNRPFYFQRGLAYFHLGKNEESLKDYANFDRLNKILCEK